MPSTDSLNEILNQFVNIFKSTLKYYAKQYPNTKTNKDTLSNSDILKDMKFDVSDGKLSIQIYSYWTRIENGSPVGTDVPISDLINWIKKKKNNRNRKGQFTNVNQFALMMKRSIKRYGISKRPIFSISYDETSKFFDEELNKYVDKITDQIIIKNLK